MTKGLQAFAERDAGFRQFNDRYETVSADPKTRHEYAMWFNEALREEGMRAWMRQEMRDEYEPKLEEAERKLENSERKRKSELEEAERKRKDELEEAERKRKDELEEAERKRKDELEEAERKRKNELLSAARIMKDQGVSIETILIAFPSLASEIEEL